MNIEPLETRISPATLYALNNANQLLRFESDASGTVTTIPLTGLGPGEALRGIDFRPETSELFAVSVTDGSANNAALVTYIVNTTTGALALVGTVPVLPGGADVPTGLDFNPAVDRMRYVNTNDENARINPNNGSLAGDDTNLTPAATTDLIGVAYDRNFANTPFATLFAINRNTSTLSRVGGVDGSPTPNSGTVTDIGSLGVTLSATADGGFDIENATGIAYAALTANDNVTRLYTVNLATGAATVLGVIGNGTMEIFGLSAAPAAIQIVNASTATYLDAEGDQVTVKVSKGTLDASNFRMAFKVNGGLELHLLDLTAPEFAQANVTISAKKTRAGGDGFAQVGRINATGVDLGKVTIAGDLAQIDAGDGNISKPAIAALNVRSLGVANVSARLFGDQISSLNGSLGSLTVKLDVQGASVDVFGDIGKVSISGSLIGLDVDGTGLLAATGNIGAVTIRGDIIGALGIRSGAVDAAGKLTSAKIGGSILGGGGLDSGLVRCALDLGAVSVTGNIAGGAGMHSGAVDSAGKLASVKVGGSVLGGAGQFSGLVESSLDMGAVSIGGSVVGGSEDHTGTVHGESSIKSVTIGGSIVAGVVTVAGDQDSGLVYTFGSGENNIGSIKVRGSVIGANGMFSGIFASDRVASIAIGGSLFGGTGSVSGAIDVTSVGSITIGGDMMGGAGDLSGSIVGNLSVGNVTVKGSLTGTGTLRAGILSQGQLGAVKISGEVRGLGSVPVLITARGIMAPGNAAEAMAVKSVTIGRSVNRANILGGVDLSASSTNPDAQIGPVTIGGDWVRSNLVAGAAAGADNFFGTPDDMSTTDGSGDGLVARISKIVIKGSVAGNYPSLDHFAFEAHEIGSLTVGGRKVLLTPGFANDDLSNPALIVAASGDVRVREVAV
jgi:hypothetical protein